MNTVFLLAAKYGASPVIEAERVREDFYPHLTQKSFRQKLEAGRLDLPVFKLDDSQKAPFFIKLADLARVFDDLHHVASNDHTRKVS